MTITSSTTKSDETSRSPATLLQMTTLTRPPASEYYAYRIARGEQGVLTFEPYKSHLLPHWRFRTVPIARTSSTTLYEHFLSFCEGDDFVGMDMARKFIQMGMTRSKRYANYKGGKKYDGGKEGGVQREKSKGHEGREEKEEASRIFKEVWERCKAHEGYQRLKERFLVEQKRWEKAQKEIGKIKSETEAKVEEEETAHVPKKRKTRSSIKKEEFN
ncbi:hypothetical protein GLAREA_09238 [Glarea lozoyensis ATCC 20868]|uniref:Uncharacterized protein n=2 Tax=Glarea lozoyensis TaxID=101852 RepID=S3DH85_GLAL2|nr:uncharacterized protein GLAREA_09238 [Glarea lozoyensis ATCC 20868]EHK96375.1 hypothetical protein M7I_7922 [Glarea lozoyensis 74030]EPE37075.1 hypothetical protein GLAREA_09238 [Glarea lozoyensis ATCC 20868]